MYLEDTGSLWRGRLVSTFLTSINKINATPENGANAKRILSVFSLGVKQGDRIIPETAGAQAEEALNTLLDFTLANFSEGLA